MLVNCNECKEDFKIEIQKERLKNLEIQYFRCPYCKRKYIYVVIDNYIRERQKEIGKLREKIKTCIKQKQVNKIIKQQDKILRNMKKHSDEIIKRNKEIL